MENFPGQFFLSSHFPSPESQALSLTASTQVAMKPTDTAIALRAPAL